MIQLNARNYAWNKRKHDTAQHSCVRHLENVLDKRDWRWHLTSAFSQRLRKYTFKAVHTKTHKQRFQIYPLWRAFSNLCVYGERFHRLRVDGRPKRIKKFPFTSVCVYNRLRVDGALGTAHLLEFYGIWHLRDRNVACHACFTPLQIPMFFLSYPRFSPLFV